MDNITQPFSDLINHNILFKQILPGLFHSRLHLQPPPVLSTVSQILMSLLPLFLVSVLVFVLLYILHKLLLMHLQLKQSFTFLEIKPPQQTLQSSYTTQQLFALIHGLAKQGSWFQRLIGNQKSYAFEIVSTKDDGIRYLLRVYEEDADLIKKSLLSYLPGISVIETKDYLPNSLSQENTTIAQFALGNHFAFPLKKQEELGEHDPIAYITGNMTKLAQDELIAFQIIVSPLNKNTVGDIKRISHLIYANKDLVKGLNNNL